MAKYWNFRTIEEKNTMREHFALTYANLLMLHKMIRNGETDLKPFYPLRTWFIREYLAGNDDIMKPLLEDERTKIKHAGTCCYCGRMEKLSLDNLIPKLRNGPDAADNITYACRSCNSSKGPRDMVIWLVSKGRFPALLVFRRYLKLAARFVDGARLMDVPWEGVRAADLPFDKQSLRQKWPALSDIRLWPDRPEEG